MKEQICLAGISMTRFGVFPERSLKDMTREAVEGALIDAGAEPADIDAAFFASSAHDTADWPVGAAGPLLLGSLGFADIPVVNLENAFAGGATAVHMAISFVRAGLADIVLAVGVEKTPAHALGGAINRYCVEMHAHLARAHMQDFGTTARQLAIIASKNHRHSTLNPFAHCRREFSLEEVLAAPQLSFPLTEPMCAPMMDGAAAAVICSRAGLRRIRASRTLKVLASVISTGVDRRHAAWEQFPTRNAARCAYEESAVGPGDISVAEVHDMSAFGELLQYEALGFCDAGGGGVFAQSGATSLGGIIPVNPSGGLESKGHSPGATGIAQLFELALQLRGEAGLRQVPGARFGLAQNEGGLYGSEDEAVAVVTILGR
jgi:acetyl-CoA acetyltransferase